MWQSEGAAAPATPRLATTGSAVPASADYTGLNVGGTLRGQTGVNASGSIYAAHTDLESIGGTTISLGQAHMTASVPVVIADNQSAIPSSQSGTWTVATNADGSVSGGTAGAKSLLMAGVYNTSQPAPTNGQQVALQLDGSGNLKVNAVAGASEVSAGPTGSGVVSEASYNGINVGGTLRGQTGVNPSGSIYATQVDLASVGGTTWTAAAALATGTSNPTAPLAGACGMLFNGTTWDPEQGTVEGTALASAARTANTTSSTLTNYNCRGVKLWLNVTAASGTGGLTLYLQGKDPISGNWTYDSGAGGQPTVTTTGVWGYEFGPGASAGATGTTASDNVNRQARCRSPDPGA